MRRVMGRRFRVAADRLEDRRVNVGLALGVACWPGPPLAGMLAYSAAVTLYLAYVAFTGVSGVLLWPAIGLHLILTALLTRETVDR